MADKEPTIVIKKINVQAAGAHGGSWKVAFADFMTAMMAFFLVMWLISQSEEVKQNVADYFSTPSIIEYNFSNYGAELTLEKLFLDLMNEPLEAFMSFIKPIDKTPNIMAMGTKKIALHFLADQLG
ncbi:MAG: chemotaxis protein MotB, partial [Bdellovibrio sp.]